MIDSREAVVLVLAGALAVVGACARDGSGDGIYPAAPVTPVRPNAPPADSAVPVATDPVAEPVATAGPGAGDEQSPLPGDDATDENSEDAEAGAADDGEEEAASDPQPAPTPTPTPTPAPTPMAPSPGEVAITEIMFDPSGPEPDAEWFEIYNLAATPRLLSGLTIQDGYADVHVIASTPPVIAPPRAYVLLVRSEATASANLVPDAAIVYEYGAGLSPDEGIELDDGSDGDLSLSNQDGPLVDVPYGQWDAEYIGQSIELADPALPSTDPSNWCLAETPWSPGSDDGTPGSPSDCERMP